MTVMQHTTPATIVVKPQEGSPLGSAILAYTTESTGYRFTFTPLAPDTEPSGYDADAEVDISKTGESGSWLPTAAEVGFSDWVPPLRRPIQVDPIDPTEALDAQDDFYGMRIV